MNQSFTIKTEIVVIIIVSFLCLLIIDYFKLDFYFADLIYQKNQAWNHKSSWLMSTVLHKYAKNIVIFGFLVFTIRTLYIAKKDKASNPHPKLVLIVALMAATGMVSVLKTIFEVDCPWDLILYGGTKPYFQLISYDPAYLPSSGCFPAAHASVGFTLISIYFYCSIHLKKYKNRALYTALILGFSFGLVQQIRGAHFISHTIWSLIICILVNILIYSLAYRKKGTRVLSKLLK